MAGGSSSWLGFGCIVVGSSEDVEEQAALPPHHEQRGLGGAPVVSTSGINGHQKQERPWGNTQDLAQGLTHRETTDRAVLTIVRPGS